MDTHWGLVPWCEPPALATVGDCSRSYSPIAQTQGFLNYLHGTDDRIFEIIVQQIWRWRRGKSEGAENRVLSLSVSVFSLSVSHSVSVCLSLPLPIPPSLCLHARYLVLKSNQKRTIYYHQFLVPTLSFSVYMTSCWNVKELPTKVFGIPNPGFQLGTSPVIWALSGSGFPPCPCGMQTGTTWLTVA